MVFIAQAIDLPKTLASEIVITSSNIQSYETILNFWFGALNGPSDIPKDKVQTWFMKSDTFDKQIEDTFSHLFESAKKGELNQWKETPKGRLALIILCDQFSRNTFRGSEKAFSFDSIALQLTLEGIENGHDLELHPLERAFFYLPLEHSEDLAIQEKSVQAFEKLHEDSPEDVKSFFHDNLDYAYRHKKIIDEFGRYPHRNEALGRKSTKEEISFLDTPGSSF